MRRRKRVGMPLVQGGGIKIEKEEKEGDEENKKGDEEKRKETKKEEEKKKGTRGLLWVGRTRQATWGPEADISTTLWQS